jgi:branched-subunit amino acid transport protein
MNWWLFIAALFFATYVTRAPFIVLSGRYELPELIRRGLRYVPAAALTAVFVPPLTMPSGAAELSPDNLRLVAGTIAFVVAWKTRSVLLPIGAGWIALLVLEWAVR